MMIKKKYLWEVRIVVVKATSQATLALAPLVL